MNFLDDNQDMWLKILVKILFINEHPVYDLLGPLVSQSFYKRCIESSKESEVAGFFAFSQYLFSYF